MSLPITTRWRWLPRTNMIPAAWPSRSAVSAVIGSELAVPRMPSVPKSRLPFTIAPAFQTVTTAL